MFIYNCTDVYRIRNFIQFDVTLLRQFTLFFVYFYRFHNTIKVLRHHSFSKWDKNQNHVVVKV